jgi:hypothetical protein
MPSGAEARRFSIIYGTAEAVPFLKTEFSRTPFSPCIPANSRIFPQPVKPHILREGFRGFENQLPRTSEAAEKTQVFEAYGIWGTG